MNILILTHTFPLTPEDGTAHFMLDFAEGFARLGNRVTVLVPFHPDIQPHAFTRITVKPFRYMYPNRFHVLGYGRTLKNNQVFQWFVPILTPLYLMFTFAALYREVRKNRPDIISAHWVLPNGVIAAAVSRLTHVPFTISLPGTDVYVAHMNGVFRWLTGVAIRLASAVISNSPQLLADLHARGSVIPYGVAEKNMRRTRHRGITIAAAGRIAVNKNFSLLTEIIPDAIILRGLPISRLRRTLTGIDIFVAPSIRDRRGNLDDANVVVIEAMAAGCTVVTSNLPGYRSFITHGKNGLLVPPGNKAALAKAIAKLKRDSSLRIRLGRFAQQTVHETLTSTFIAARYLALFRRAITT